MLLTSVLDNSDKVAEYIAECRDCGIELLPPDVNRSSDGFTVEDRGIRFGLVAIKNIGRGFIQTMMRRREQDGPFRSFQDFCQRMFDCTDMNKRAVENLIRSGAFDSMKVRRSQLIQVFEKVLDSIAESRRKNVEGQLDLFGMAAGEDAPPAETPLPDIPEFTAAERMFMEKETTGLYLSGHWPGRRERCLSTPFWRTFPPRTGLSGSPTARASPLRASSPPAAPAPPATTPSWPT